jgi:hypothetical protein
VNNIKNLAPLPGQDFRGFSSRSGTCSVVCSKKPVKVSTFLLSAEAAALCELMITSKTIKTKYHDPRHEYIYGAMIDLIKILGYVDTESLIDYLAKYNHIDNGLDVAGGADYIRSILGEYEAELRLEQRFLLGGAA